MSGPIMPQPITAARLMSSALITGYPAVLQKSSEGDVGLVHIEVFLSLGVSNSMTFTINDNGLDRPMTDDEISATKVLQAAAAIQLKAKQDAETAKDAAKAKLEALGLTLDDLTALGL